MGEVDLIAEHISPQYRLAVYLQSGTGQRPSEALAFSTECRRSGFVRVRRQVSAKAHHDDCRTALVPLKHRTEGEYRDVPAAPVVEQEIDDHLSRWALVSVAFTGLRGRRRRLEVFFPPRRQRGKGVMPTAATFGCHFKKACAAAGVVDVDGKAKYTPGSLRRFFTSTALGNGVPIREVSRGSDSSGSGPLLLPRFHQWEAVTSIVAAAKEEGVGHRYLIEHWAGSGATNTIDWTAHGLARPHDAVGV
nr:site-specific integrase [Streptomyces typhae]